MSRQLLLLLLSRDKKRDTPPYEGSVLLVHLLLLSLAWFVIARPEKTLMATQEEIDNIKEERDEELYVAMATMAPIATAVARPDQGEFDSWVWANIMRKSVISWTGRSAGWNPAYRVDEKKLQFLQNTFKPVPPKLHAPPDQDKAAWYESSPQQIASPSSALISAPAGSLTAEAMMVVNNPASQRVDTAFSLTDEDLKALQGKYFGAHAVLDHMTGHNKLPVESRTAYGHHVQNIEAYARLLKESREQAADELPTDLARLWSERQKLFPLNEYAEDPILINTLEDFLPTFEDQVVNRLVSRVHEVLLLTELSPQTQHAELNRIKQDGLRMLQSGRLIP